MSGRHATFSLRQELVSSRRRHRGGRRSSVCRRCGKTLRWKSGTDECALCGAANARNPTWWRDGRFPIWLLVCIGLTPLTAVLVWQAAPLIEAPAKAVAAGAGALALAIGLPAARARVRRPINFAIRAGLLASVIAYTLVLHELVMRMV